MPLRRLLLLDKHVTCIRKFIFNVQNMDDFRLRVIKSKKPVIVDFHANWCGPCKIIGPRLEKEVGRRKEDIYLAKIDVDSLSELADQYQVSALPTIIAIKDGKEVDKFMGVKEEDYIKSFIDKVIYGPL